MKEARRDLRSRFTSTRVRAIRRLAQLPGREARDLLVASLADREGAVGEAVQVLLSSRPDADLRARILGTDGLRAKDSLAQRRAAALVGAWQPPPPPGRLTPVLRRLEGKALVDLLESVERIALGVDSRKDPAWRAGTKDHGALQRAVEGLVASRRAGVRPEALLALAALDPEAGRRQAAVLEDERDPRLRTACLLVEVVGHHGEGTLPGPGWASLSEEGVRRATRLLGDDDARVRRAAVLALGATPTKAAAEALVGHLPREARQRLRADVVRSLQARSGLRHGADPRPWRDWLARLDAEDQEGAPRPRRRADTGAGTRAVGTVALPLTSDALALLVDLSGSVSRTLEGGRTRRELIDEVVLATLSQVPEGTWLQLVPFTAKPEPIPDEPARAERRTLERWAKDFKGLQPRGPGDLWEALEFILPERELDTLLVLTDGVPTGGYHAEPAFFVERFLPGWRLDPLAVDLVLVDASKRHQRNWSVLASRTHGSLNTREFAAAKTSAAGGGG